MTQLEYDLEEHLKENCYKCTECATPIESQGVCSRECFKTSML
mgnify:CR=1 FL=1